MTTVPEKWKWLFEFEYSDDQEKCKGKQKRYDRNAQAHREDRINLDKYLEGLSKKNNPKVIYRTYKANFEKARLTGEKDEKHFAVGYVKDHDKFTTDFENDLFDSILNNFGKFGEENIASNTEKLLHLNAIKSKSTNFVGRLKLRRRLVTYCTTVGGNACKIIHGEPGCGKSGLLAAVADVSVKITELKDGFIFIHIVDCSAGSSSLEKAVRRCCDELLEWRRRHRANDYSPLDFDQSDTNVEHVDLANKFLCDIFDEKELKLNTRNFASLKENFLDFIYNTAEAYPDANFSFIFDAVKASRIPEN